MGPGFSQGITGEGFSGFQDLNLWPRFGRSFLSFPSRGYPVRGLLAWGFIRAWPCVPANFRYGSPLFWETPWCVSWGPFVKPRFRGDWE